MDLENRTHRELSKYLRGLMTKEVDVDKYSSIRKPNYRGSMKPWPYTQFRLSIMSRLGSSESSEKSSRNMTCSKSEIMLELHSDLYLSDDYWGGGDLKDIRVVLPNDICTTVPIPTLITLSTHNKFDQYNNYMQRAEYGKLVHEVATHVEAILTSVKMNPDYLGILDDISHKLDN